MAKRKKTKKTAKKVAKKAKKVTKKKPVKKTAAKAKKKRTAPKAKKVKKTSTKSPAAPPIPGVRIGTVTHYFPHVNAAVVKVEAGELKLGDSLYFKGHTTDFKQSLTSLQIDRRPIEVAHQGDEVGVEVKDRVRQGDDVYRLR